jgi:hypothetical protein
MVARVRPSLDPFQCGPPEIYSGTAPIIAHLHACHNLCCCAALVQAENADRKPTTWQRLPGLSLPTDPFVSWRVVKAGRTVMVVRRLWQQSDLGGERAFRQVSSF